MKLEKIRTVLVTDSQHVAESLCGDERDIGPFSFEKCVRGTSGTQVHVDIADDTGAPLGVTAGAAWEAFGYSTGRPNDRMGISYFYNALNSDFQETLSLFEPAEDVHGGEFYYNAEFTPWFHLTFDLQAINTTFKSNDTAVVIGTRARLEF